MTWKSKYTLILLYFTTFNPDYVKLLDIYLPSEKLKKKKIKTSGFSWKKKIKTSGLGKYDFFVSVHKFQVSLS